MWELERAVNQTAAAGQTASSTNQTETKSADIGFSEQPLATVAAAWIHHHFSAFNDESVTVSQLPPEAALCVFAA